VDHPDPKLGVPRGTRAEAQARIDQIQSFRKEFSLLQSDGVAQLNDDQRQAIDSYHVAITERLSRDFDVDSDTHAKQLSLGMRVASFLGALSLAASVFFFFYKFWGDLGTAAQVSILVLVPLATFTFTVWLSRRDSSGYFTKVAALVAFACFVLNLSMLGKIFNMTSSPNAFLACAAFALLLAYSLDSRLLLVAGLICLVTFTSARFGTLSGEYWIDFGRRPENFFPTAAMLLIAAFVINHRRFDGFAMSYRIVGLLTLFGPVLVLSNWGEISYLAWNISIIEGAYQIAGFVVASLTIWLGIRRGFNDVVNTGAAFFVVLLYTKFYDWWWESMPKYVFFLVVGLTALLLLRILRRLRTLSGSAGARAS
jgi:uncharacterized membrane protein